MNEIQAPDGSIQGKNLQANPLYDVQQQPDRFAKTHTSLPSSFSTTEQEGAPVPRCNL